MPQCMGRKSNDLVDAADRSPQDRKLTRPGALTIALFRPRIPQNTGSIARLCASTGSKLELIDPFFAVDDAKLKRAGLDYWPLLDVGVFASWADWIKARQGQRIFAFEVSGTTLYSEARFQENDVLLFGDEQEGLEPEHLGRIDQDKRLLIPQIQVRSINLAMCAAIASFEAYRQLGFPYVRHENPTASKL